VAEEAIGKHFRTYDNVSGISSSSPSEGASKRPGCFVPDPKIKAVEITSHAYQSHYQLFTSSEVAGHLAYNMVQGRRLTSLDGFADQPEDAARVLDIYVDDDVTETNTESPTQPRSRTKPSKKKDPK
jgi:hypothetical protein